LIPRGTGLRANPGLITGAYSFHVGFPPNAQADILRSVGLSEAAICQILLVSGGGLAVKFYEALRAAGPRVGALLEEWRRKLEVLEQEGRRIGIISGLDTFKVQMRFGGGWLTELVVCTVEGWIRQVFVGS
jgi:hypothetical protein